MLARISERWGLCRGKLCFVPNASALLLEERCVRAVDIPCRKGNPLAAKEGTIFVFLAPPPCCLLLFSFSSQKVAPGWGL
jgi:hypothetical protein